MKIIYIEASAEDMRANRTVLDSLTETLNNITRAFAGPDLDPKDIAAGLARMAEEEEDEDDEQQTESETL